MRSLLRIRFLRFLAVGAVNTAFSYAVYACLLWAGLNYALANLGSLLLGIAFSFHTQGRLVFDNHDHRLIFRFALCWGLIFVVNLCLIAALIRFGLNAYWAGALAIVPVAVLSYFVQKAIVFGGSTPATKTPK